MEKVFSVASRRIIFIGLGGEVPRAVSKQRPPTHQLSLLDARSGVFLFGLSFEGSHEFLQVLLDGQSLEDKESSCLNYACISQVCSQFSFQVLRLAERHYSERLQQRTLPRCSERAWLADSLQLSTSAGSATSFELRSHPFRGGPGPTAEQGGGTGRWPFPPPWGSLMSTRCSGLPLRG